MISVLLITYSLFVTDVSVYITLSFLKIIMIVRVTDVVMAYKQVRQESSVVEQKTPDRKSGHDSEEDEA